VEIPKKKLSCHHLQPLRLGHWSFIKGRARQNATARGAGFRPASQGHLELVLQDRKLMKATVDGRNPAITS